MILGPIVTPLLRVFGITLLLLVFLATLAIAPFTAGFSLIVGVPLLAAAIWLIRHDPGKSPDVSRADVVALVVVVLALSWLLLVLVSEADILGRPV